LIPLKNIRKEGIVVKTQKMVAIILSIVLAVTLSVAGMNATKRYRIAFIMKTLTNPFFITMRRGAEKAAGELKNVDLLVQVSAEETSFEEQLAIMEDMIAKKVDAICIAPSSPKTIFPAVAKAYKQKIPVIDIDVLIDPAMFKAEGLKPAPYVGADNFGGGYMAGKWLVRRLGGKGNVAILEGAPGVDNGVKRKSGAEKAFREAPGIRLVASQTANWKTEEALNVFTNILQAHPNLNGVFCANDMMAFGAIQAIEAAGKTGKIAVASFDALDAAKEAIKTGAMGCSIDQRPDLMGYYGVKYALDTILGKKVPEVYMVPLTNITRASLK
jgi:ribose transport system substrate-binding protein